MEIVLQILQYLTCSQTSSILETLGGKSKGWLKCLPSEREVREEGREVREEGREMVGCCSIYQR